MSPAADLDRDLSKLRIDRTRRRSGAGVFGKLAIALILLCGLGAGGWVYYDRARGAVTVRVAKVQREETGGAVASAVLSATGYVIPRDRIDVSTKIIGRVKDIYVDRGDRVKAGDLILKLEDEEYVAQLKLYEARAETARARLDEMRAGSRPQEIRAAQAELASTEATLIEARADLERLQTLARDSIISQQELDRGQAAYDVALARRDAAAKRAELVEVGPRVERIAQAEAEMREAEANVEYSKTQLSFTEIVAPISGTILQKVAKKGEMVTNSNFGGTTGARSSIVSMADLRDLQVEVDINENDLPRVKMGQSCEVRLDSVPDLVVRGEVDEIAPQADRQKATVQVKIRLIDPGPEVRPEAGASVTFLRLASAGDATDARACVWAPAGAVAERDGRKVVFIAVDGRAVLRAVKVGATGPKGIEVIEGLIGGESLVVEPLNRMTDGARIEAPS